MNFYCVNYVDEVYLYVYIIYGKYLMIYFEKFSFGGFMLFKGVKMGRGSSVIIVKWIYLFNLVNDMFEIEDLF